MRSLQRRVGRFLLAFAVAVAVLAPLWSYAAPYYTRVAVDLARPLFRCVENPDVTVVKADRSEVWIFRRIGDGRVSPFTYYDRYTFFALIPLIALFVATPGLGIRRRLARTVLGVCGLYALHVTYLVVSVELAYVAMGLTPVGSFGARTLDGWQVVVRVLWEAGPIVIWLALTAGPWKRAWKGLRVPCASGAPCADEPRSRGGTRIARLETGKGRTT